MSEGIDTYIKKKFEVPDVDIRTYSPLTLAYICLLYTSDAADD